MRIDAALMLAGDAELVVQHGHTEPVAAGPNVRYYEWLRPDEVNVFFRDATVVITHAGVAHDSRGSARWPPPNRDSTPQELR